MNTTPEKAKSFIFYIITDISLVKRNEIRQINRLWPPTKEFQFMHVHGEGCLVCGETGDLVKDVKCS